MMLDLEAERYVAAIRPALRASATKQGFAKALHRAAHSLIVMARPRTAEDVQALDELLVPELARHRIEPEGKLGVFARARVRELATLPWQAAVTSGDFIPAGGGSPGVITFGQMLGLTRNAVFESGFTFTGLTGLNGFAKIIMIVQWNIRSSVASTPIPDYVCSLNGVNLNKLIASSFNSSSDRYKYTQTGILWLDNPTNGSLVINFGASQYRVLAVTIFPVNGAAAGAAAFGVPVTTLVASNSRTLPNLLTTTVADTSWRIGTFGSRHYIATPLVLNDLTHTKLREKNFMGETGHDLSVVAFRKKNEEIGVKNLGVTWASSGQTDDWSSGHSFELLAAT